MTQPSTPTLTPVVGAPATITRRTQLTGIITYDGPYQGGSVGAGLGSVPIAWDATLSGGTGGWRNTNTNAALTLPLARADVTGTSAPTGQLVIDLTWVDESGARQSDQLRMKPIAGTDGVLDLTRDQTPAAVVATSDLVAAVQQAAQIPTKLTQLNTATTAANTAAVNANAARIAIEEMLPEARSIVDAAPDVLAGAALLPTLQTASAQASSDHTRAATDHQQVVDNLAGIAQAQALATAAAGIQPRDNLAAITGPDGYYSAMDTGYVYQRAGGSNARRRDLEAASNATAPTRINASNAGGITAALAAHDRVLIPGGAYSLTAPLALRPGVDVQADRGIIAAEPGYTPPQLATLSSGARVSGIVLDGANMPQDSIPWVGGYIGRGTGYSAVGTSAEPITDLRIEGEARNLPAGAVYLIWVKNAYVDINVSGAGVGTNVPGTVAAGILVGDSENVTSRITGGPLGMKGISYTRVKNGLMTGSYMVGGNVGHAALFVRACVGNRVINNYVSGRWGIKTDGSVGSIVTQNTLEGCDASAIMVQGSGGEIIAHNTIRDAAETAVHVLYHPSATSAWTGASGVGSPARFNTVAYNTMTQSAGYDEVNTARVAVIVNGGASAELENEGTLIAENVISGGHTGVGQGSVTGGIVRDLRIEGNRISSVRNGVAVAPASGKITGNTLRDVRRGIIVEGGAGQVQGDTLIIQGNSVAMRGAATGDYGIYVNSTMRYARVVIEDNDVSGGHIPIIVQVGVTAGVPHIGEVIVRRNRANGGTSSNGFNFLVQDGANTRPKLTFEGNQSDRGVILTGDWDVTETGNTVTSMTGLPGEVKPYRSAGLPSSGTWQVGNLVTNTAPAAGGWSAYLCTVSGTAGTLSGVTATTTNGTNTMTLSSVTGVRVGQYVTVAGGAGKRTITALDPISKIITVNANSTGSVTAALTLSPPTFKGVGAIEA